MRGLTNLSIAEAHFGNLAEVEQLQVRAVELARRAGDREGEWFALGNLTGTYFEAGKWDEVLDVVAEVPPGLETQAAFVHGNTAEVARHRGDLALARKALGYVERLAGSASVQDRAVYVSTRAASLFAEARHDQVVELLADARADLEADASQLVWMDLLTAEAALAAGRHDAAAEALASDALGPEQTEPGVRAQTTRFRAQISAAAGDVTRAEESFKVAAASFREYGMPFYLACTQQEHAEWLISVGRADEAEPLVAEAREVFERLRATPWLERANALAAQLPTRDRVPA
jgi:tetratricopeptide (TPR) repeat protein